jgi:hypothetical protein
VISTDVLALLCRSNWSSLGSWLATRSLCWCLSESLNFCARCDGGKQGGRVAYKKSYTWICSNNIESSREINS